jgi:hypothetical protein
VRPGLRRDDVWGQHLASLSCIAALLSVIYADFCSMIEETWNQIGSREPLSTACDNSNKWRA